MPRGLQIGYILATKGMPHEVYLLLTLIGIWLVACFGAILFAIIRAAIVSGQRGVRAGHCVKCGYDLYGLPEPRCPECGTGFAVAAMHGPAPVRPAYPLGLMVLWVVVVFPVTAAGLAWLLPWVIPSQIRSEQNIGFNYAVAKNPPLDLVSVRAWGRGYGPFSRIDSMTVWLGHDDASEIGVNLRRATGGMSTQGRTVGGDGIPGKEAIAALLLQSNDLPQDPRLIQQAAGDLATFIKDAAADRRRLPQLPAAFKLVADDTSRVPDPDAWFGTVEVFVIAGVLVGGIYMIHRRHRRLEN